MKQPVGRIAVEGKHIVRDFRLGTANHKGTKGYFITGYERRICINHGAVRLREKHAAIHSRRTGQSNQRLRPSGRNRYFPFGETSK